MAANAKLPARWDPLAILIADQRACANYIEARGLCFNMTGIRFNVR